MSNGTIDSGIGICGKIPTRGDFLAQGLPIGFIDSWNEWLQAVLAVSKEQLGEVWLEKYLTSPIWHFAMSSRVCGDSAMAGTFIPSVDQVGRNYPFAIVKEITQAPIQVWSDQTWSEKLEPWILATLDDDFYLEPWLEMLCKEDMSWPEMQPVTASVVQSERQTKSQMIESVNDSTLSQLGLLHQSYTDLYGRYCLWWTQGSEEVPPCLLVTSGLPQVSQFSAMLDGNWERWGWQQKQIVG